MHNIAFIPGVGASGAIFFYHILYYTIHSCFGQYQFWLTVNKISYKTLLETFRKFQNVKHIKIVVFGADPAKRPTSSISYFCRL